MQSIAPHPAGQAVAPISDTEQRELTRLETVIDKGLHTFVEVGKALIEIRDKSLFRTEHATFGDYCQSRWGFSRSRAQQLIAGATVAERVESVTRVTPHSEAVARQLNRLPEDQQVEVWQEVVNKAAGTPTAADTRAVVESRLTATAPCLNCGSTDRDEDEDGTCCRQCKEPLEAITATVEPVTAIMDTSPAASEITVKPWVSKTRARGLCRSLRDFSVQIIPAGSPSDHPCWDHLYKAQLHVSEAIKLLERRLAGAPAGDGNQAGDGRTTP